MKKALLGRKLGMTQIFNDQGKTIPVTVIEAGPCTVTQVKTVETDGYNAIQLGFGDIKEKKVNVGLFLIGYKELDYQHYKEHLELEFQIIEEVSIQKPKTYYDLLNQLNMSESIRNKIYVYNFLFLKDFQIHPSI